MKKGFRQAPMASKGEAIQELQTKIANMEMAMRMNQMMVQQLLTQIQRLDRDMGNSMSITNDLEYRTRAMLEVGGTNKDAVSAKADEMKLVDYNLASDKEDIEKGYTIEKVVTQDSIVIISSETSDGEGSIFRSKFKLADSGIPALVEGMQGKMVGEFVEITLNEKLHKVILHGIRQAPAVVEAAPELSILQ